MLHATRALPALTDLTPTQQAYFGYLANYEGNTRRLYEYHLSVWFQWCADQGIDPMAAERTHLALFVRYRSEVVGNKASTINTMFAPIKGLYAYAVIEGLIDRDPAAHVRLPKIHRERKYPLDREELRSIRKAGKKLGGRHWALAELLVVHGLRISECCSLLIEDMQDTENGHRVMRLTRKGGKRVTIPIPVAVLIALEAAQGDRTEGPLIATRDGRPLNRHGATGLVDTILRHTKIERHINPHLIRASVITDGFEQGLPGRDVQNFAGHADPRTTSYYDLGLRNHDRHLSHIMAARLTA